jgi:rRNA maturation protein Nop10
MNCFFCSRESTEKKVHTRDECPACGRDLHICRNCRFYDANVYRQCRENLREPVQDKEKAKFCDFFQQSACGNAEATGRVAARKRLDDLFS